MMGYFITNLSFNSLVKEFLKPVNIWQSYKQNGCVILPILSYIFVIKDAELVR